MYLPLQETQDELTSELLDLKEKYREVVDLLRDANEEIRKGRKRTYPGMGKQSGMFPGATYQKGESSVYKALGYSREWRVNVNMIATLWTGQT